MMFLAPFLKYIAGGLAILSLVLGLALWASRERADRLDRRVTELTELRKFDRKTYENAQREAELRNKATVKKIEERNEAITDRVRSDYQRDLERLRLQSKANRGSPGGPSVSSVPKAAGGADPEELCVPSERLLLAQELELKRNALIDWVNGQLGAR